MTSAINSFEQQKQQALKILSKLSTFVQERKQSGRPCPSGSRNEVGEIGAGSDGAEAQGRLDRGLLRRQDIDRRRLAGGTGSQEHEHQPVGVIQRSSYLRIQGPLQIIDTPELFGFKEKTNATSQEIERYKDITKHYVSEAHLVLYVMNSANPIKESHAEDLKWLFRTLSLLPRTVFVLSRFDDVADVAEETDFQDKFLIKKNSVIKRLNDVLELTPQEQSDLSVVAVSANPFDMGVDHWFAQSVRIPQTLAHRRAAECYSTKD